MVKSNRGSSLRSRRKHKAWGASPRKTERDILGARETGDSLGISQAFARFAGSLPKSNLNLGLTPQALFFRLLRRLTSLVPA
jgi:hypothetical protein